MQIKIIQLSSQDAFEEVVNKFCKEHNVLDIDYNVIYTSHFIYSAMIKWVK